MNTDSCLFCEFGDDDEKKVWEGKYLYAFFDENPVNPGHALIIPKRHVVLLEGLSSGEWGEYKNAIGEVKAIIRKTSFKDVYSKMLASTNSKTTNWFLKKSLNGPFINKKPDAYNYGVNDGRAAGRTIDHLHWQIIPRYEGDVDDPRGGVRFVISEMGNYKTKR